MPFAATAVVAMAVVATALSAGCSTDMDCSLNGLCQSGACACDKGWGGTDCGVLNLGPAPPGGAYGYVLTPCLSNHPACKNSPALLVVHNCHADSCILITTLRSDVPAHGRVRRRYSPNVSSWGAHVIKWTDNQYHMYVSEMWNDCGIDSWQVRCPASATTLFAEPRRCCWGCPRAIRRADNAKQQHHLGAVLRIQFPC